ncbi:hypothetical protein GCM10008910_22750 [Faecalicatena orotica]|uniref:Nodulation protein Z n=1 Tax=Faecalicatena orotica TaxID=1544 RepID=A0A2Y9C6Q0_9FIRM|nr:hypothetical protein [Faecalicatena orotica]PWJ20743.1 nodulation protein Z [Faecalicatena orotica]SSA58542.1 Nodulation protein Z (NodZ) [Faecalicatena orotica]
MRFAILKRIVKDRIKKITTKKYCICIKNWFSKDDRYYLIRRKIPWAGFYANYLYVAGHIVYALKKGYIPVIDMENYPTLYNEVNTYKGTKNAWEYYFEQPFGISVKDAMESKNYILSDFSTMREYLPYKDGKNYFTIDWFKANEIVDVINTYLLPKEEISSQVENFYKEKMRGKRVLGVHYRGTDKKIKVANHFLSASLENYLACVYKNVLEYNPDAILLCTDDEEAIAVFLEKFPEKVFFSEAFRAKKGDIEGIHLKKNVERENHNYLLGKEVIFDVMLLSKCDYFVFSHSNVATTVMFINNQKFTKTYFVED